MTKRQITTLFVVTRLAMVVIAGVSQSFIEKGPWYPPAPQNPFDVRLAFFRWDAHWYYGIADAGYFYTPGEESSVAFLPVYPLAVRAAAWVLRDGIWSGLLVSNACLLLAAFALQRLVARETDNPRAGDTATLFLLLCPVGVFFSILYSEALFILLAILSVDETRRGRFGRGALLCALASATKTLGVLLLLPLAIEIASAIRDRRGSAAAWLWLLVGASGLATYALYLGHAFGEPLAFLSAQRAWGRELAPPWEGLRDLRTHSISEQIAVITTIAAGVALLSELADTSVWRGYFVYGAIFFVLNASTRVLVTLPRYTCGIFPMYLALAVATADRPALRRVLLTVSAALFAVTTALFVNGYRLL